MEKVAYPNQFLSGFLRAIEIAPVGNNAKNINADVSTLCILTILWRLAVRQIGCILNAVGFLRLMICR